jgi:DNA-binding transcriptional LysR family regulator
MYLDPELLRTFLAFAEGGSLARAAEAVGRTPSAVTAQMQRLEALVGESLLAPAGRGRTLTPTGEELVGHARRILAAHRGAWLSLKGAKAGGRVALGSTQDFSDSALSDLLRVFARTHSRVRLDLRIGRTQELTAALEQGSIDILIAMRQATTTHEIAVRRDPMLWLSASQGLINLDEELPLALLDPPCGFRSAAIAALDAAGRRYRIAATSPSLSGLFAAVRSGIALTPRTRRSIDANIVEASVSFGLPKLPAAEFSLRLRPDAAPAAAELATLLGDGLAQGVSQI